MKLLNFALIKLTLSLISGIVFAFYFDVPVTITIAVVVVLLVCLLVVLIIEKGHLVKSLVFGVLTFLVFFSIGMSTYQFHDQKRFKTHYSQYIDPTQTATKTITFRIREVLKPGVNYDKYFVNMLQVDKQPLSGKILLNVQKDSGSNLFNVDDVYTSISSLKDLNSPLNPNQFDYKKYLQKQYVHHQIFSDRQHLLKIPSDTHTLFGYAANLRRTINSKLRLKNFKPDELALINALLLGQRQDISPEIYDSYTKAGAIHILAISGLHIGIILILLNSLFKPLEYFRHGRLIKTLVLVIVLWSFAVVAGLSASVTRAVMMFSVVAIGINLKRPSNIYNTLVSSMFFLLLFRPLLLFDVGFQMSYLAVMAIVSIQPLLDKLWQPNFKPIKKLWQILTVTLAAQIGVVPISLYYFHQFPGLFFLSNLVIIPFLGVVLGLGVVVIFLALMNILPFWLADIYGGIINGMTQFVRWVSLQERFVFKDISFELPQVVTAYFFIIALLLVLKKQNFKRLIVVMISVLIFQSVLIVHKRQNQTKAFVVFHKSKYTILGIKSDTTLRIFHNLDRKVANSETSITNYRIGNSIKTISHDIVENIYKFQNHKILVIDSLGIYKIPQFYPDYILLRNSPKINLTRLLDSIKPKLVIADGSNYKSYTQRWESSCTQQKIPFHLTGEKGAFILKR